MNHIEIVAVIIILIKFCAARENIQQDEHVIPHDSIAITGGCDNFFQGNPWPSPKDIKNRGIVKLCQTENEVNGFGEAVFASMFSTVDRIPVYTANTIILRKNATEHDRPDSRYWERVVTTLCDINQLPSKPIDSNLKFVHKSMMETCRPHQAVAEDYFKNGMQLDRGHLSPNSINSRDLEKQRGTFTLTNAAPQFAYFNRNSWRVYECVTEFSTLQLVPDEKVYIITGTYGTALDNNNNPLWMNGEHLDSSSKNPVKVPGYYWKAVCYPGNPAQGKAAFGYAIIKKNVNLIVVADKNSYITLKEFSTQYFSDPPFGPDCMNAPFGDFNKILASWDDFLKEHCDEEKFWPKHKKEL